MQGDVVDPGLQSLVSKKERRLFNPQTRFALQAYSFLVPSFIGLLIFSLLPKNYARTFTSRLTGYWIAVS